MNAKRFVVIATVAVAAPFVVAAAMRGMYLAMEAFIRHLGVPDAAGIGGYWASIIGAMLATAGLAFGAHVVLSRIRPTPVVAATDNEGGEHNG